MKIQFHQDVSLRYKIEKIRNGETLPGTDFVDHMITDAGLDKVAAQNNGWLDCITSVILGDNVSPTPVRRDSGAVTFTQSGTTLTASAGFFSAADVGRLFKWGTGEAGAEVYITVYTSTTQVTVGASASVSTPTIGTVWYVNTAALLTPITGITFSKQTNGTENNSVGAVSGDTYIVTDNTVFYSSAFIANKTVSEIAFSNNTTNASVFDRDSVSPTVGFVIGDQAKITLQLVRRYYPITSQAVANFATGYNSAGNALIECIRMSGNTYEIAYFDTMGGVVTSQGRYLEPCSSSLQISVSNTTFNLQAFSSTTAGPVAGLTITSKSCSPSAYGTGTYYRDWSCLFAISEAIGTIYGFFIGYSSSLRLFTHKLTTPFSKLGTQTLSFTVRKSWSRILNN